MARQLRVDDMSGSYSSSSPASEQDSGVRVTVRPPVGQDADPFGVTRIFELQRPTLVDPDEEVTRFNFVPRDPPTEPHLAVADPFEVHDLQSGVRIRPVLVRADNEHTLVSREAAQEAARKVVDKEPAEYVLDEDSTPVPQQALTVRVPRRPWYTWPLRMMSWMASLFTRTAR